MIRYLILLHLCLLVLYGLYRWCLHRLPYFRLNRLYLLLIPLLCGVLPLIRLPLPPALSAGFVVLSQDYWEPLPDTGQIVPAENSSFDVDLAAGLLYVYVAGMLVQLIRSGRSWLKASRALCLPSGRRGHIHRRPDLSFSCTFFSHIYLGKDYLGLDPGDRHFLLRHEVTHARSGHTWDLLWLTFFQVLAWCNPLSRHLLQAIRAVHEFQADQAAAPAPRDFPAYARLLLKLRQNAHTLPVAAFHSHPLTERMIMLKQTFTSRRMRPLAYLLTLPVLLMLVIIMAFRATDVVEQVPLAATISADNHFPDLKPVAADITSGFGMRMHPEIKEKRMHKGVDFQVASGTAVKAAGSGTVSDIQHHPHTYGELLIIDHGNGYLSRYAHLSEIKYKIGETVQQGEVVALSGNTGMSSVPHLHFEILYQGNFIDPETLLK